MSGPYETTDEVVAATRHIFDASRREGRPSVMAHISEGLLLAELREAEVDLGAFDRRVVGWLADCTPETQAVIGWIERARYAQWLRTFHAENLVDLMDGQSMTRAEAEKFLAQNPLDAELRAQGRAAGARAVHAAGAPHPAVGEACEQAARPHQEGDPGLLWGMQVHLLVATGEGVPSVCGATTGAGSFQSARVTCPACRSTDPASPGAGGSA